MSSRTNLKKFRNQYLAAFVATLGSFAFGCVLAWSSPALPGINQQECGITCDLTNVTSEQSSWIGPLVPIGAIISGPVSGYLINKLGRKGTLMLSTFPFFIGTCLVSISSLIDNVVILYIGRFVAGLAGGIFALVAPLYASEISEASIRGITASMMQLMVTFGVGFVYGLNINGFVNWIHISAISAVIPVLMLGLLAFVPESPYFLVSHGSFSKAEKALMWLRRATKQEVASELRRLQLSKSAQEKVGSVSIKTLFSRPKYLRPFFISMALMFFQQFAGVNAVMFYTETIFNKAGSTMDSGLSAFLVAVFQILGTAFALILVDKFGRKILLILSEVAVCISMSTLGTYFYFEETKSYQFNSTVRVDLETDATLENGKENYLGWLPLLSLIIYIFFFSLGLGPLAWTMNVELFPPESKSLCSSIAFTFNWMCAFLVTKCGLEMEAAMSTSGVYFFYSCVGALGAIFIFTKVPETKGKSSEEIEKFFLGQSPKGCVIRS